MSDDETPDVEAFAAAHADLHRVPAPPPGPPPRCAFCGTAMRYIGRRRLPHRMLGADAWRCGDCGRDWLDRRGDV